VGSATVEVGHRQVVAVIDHRTRDEDTNDRVDQLAGAPALLEAASIG
jgi:hypothetical protein